MNKLASGAVTCAGSRERGAVLIVSLVLLLVMTILGMSSMRSTTMQERMAGNLRDSNLAFQAAEAGLRAGEAFLRQATLPPFAGSDGLLLRQDGAGQADFWNAFNWADNGRAAPKPAGVAEAPQFVIEELPPMAAEGGSLKFGPLSEVAVYRITARGVGGTTDAVSILQTTYRR